MSLLQIKDVCLKYPKSDNWIIRDFSAEIEKTDIFGLLGPNGSGKTTLIRSILGFLNIGEGEIHVMGDSPDSIAIRQKIGYTPENLAFFEDMKAYRHLQLFAKLNGINSSDMKDRIEEILQDFALDDDVEKPLSEYSKGMRRRFGLCQAFLHKPDFIILDEPTAGLDVDGIITLRNVIKRHSDRDATFFISSHNLSEIEKLCNRVAFIKNGTLITLKDLQSRDEKINLEDLYRKWIAKK